MTAVELRLARMLAAIWVLSASRPAELEASLAPSVLDTGLRQLSGAQKFPDWAKGALHFAEGLSGPRCLELFAIISAAQASGLAELLNPRYKFIRFTIGRGLAAELAQEANLSLESAIELGRTLRKGVKERQKVMQEFQYA